jgi:hypothetical protein
MKQALLWLGIVLSLGLATPAYADHGGDRYDQREGCGEQGGGCNNEREEDYSGAGCKYVCPTFDKSPVHDAFNFSPFICMPGATCYEDGGKRQPPQEGQQPPG